MQADMHADMQKIEQHTLIGTRIFMYMHKHMYICQVVNRKAHTYKRLLREAQAHVHGLQAENAALRQGVDKVCTEMEASRQEHHHVLAKYEHAMRAIDVGAAAPCLLR